MTFDTVLIANRGEIACRIIRTLREMGLRSVAVYSDADCDALHVRLADRAVHIGPSPASESYLNIEKIMAAAGTSGADAVHPGYGFLSENADFARACKQAGLIFIGPAPEAIALMGDKAVAKREMIEAGVPCIPGYQGEAQNDATLMREAEAIGFPVMVKAAAGGGGRGMRLVETPEDLMLALSESRAEALSAFGSDTLILERAILRPRHVEVQIFGDRQGNVIHLGERDCSVQRRHQKVIEEAPCPVLTPQLRARMGEAAIAAARRVNYVGAGTVEFILDAAGDFHFLEMNTRLQVEHPVTESITGFDLVALQIRIAQGEPLGLTQDDVKLSGHAIEARLYAEDPTRDFLPATGKVVALNFPDFEGLRVDSGIGTGTTLSPYYDPMMAKLVASGPDRETARRTLVRALEETVIFGVTTNRSFLIDALRKPDFKSGKATTAFIAENFGAGCLEPLQLSDTEAALAATAQYVLARDALTKRIPQSLLGWNSAASLAAPFIYEGLRVEVVAQGPTRFAVTVGDETRIIRLLERSPESLRLEHDGRRYALKVFAPDTAHLHISFGVRQFSLVNTAALRAQSVRNTGEGDIRAPMHGSLAEILVASGQSVQIGDRLAVLEAMKMRHDILADRDGVVSIIHVKAGEQIAADAPLMEIGPQNV